MKAIIITIGDELLIGQTTDTNSAWIGGELSRLGFDVFRKISVHDKREDILNVLADSEGKADVIIITGGLGPTSDDITKPALCEFFGTKLISDKEVLGMIEKMMERRNFPMNENNRKQAEVPESCRVLTNAAGTAPGMWFEKGNSVFVSMPGVPDEMKYIMRTHVIPLLQERFTSQAIVHKNIMTYGMPEARLAELLEGFEKELPGSVKLAYLPSSGIIKLRLTATGEKKEILQLNIDDQVKKLYSIIPEQIYGEDEESLEMVIGKMLSIRNMTLCTAESCTGGYIAHRITSVAGSSGYFKGSVIAYDNTIKTSLLGTDAGLISREGAVSESVVKSMAEGARRVFNSDFSIATSGIAGPSGGSIEKPVGTIWMAASSKNGTVTEKRIYGTDRMGNIIRFSTAALDLLRRQIINNKG